MTHPMGWFRDRHEAADAPPHTLGDELAFVMVRAGRGDQRAFADLYDSISGLVHGVVLRVVRDPSHADEVTQEVFLELWRLAPRFDPERGTVRGWAATVAHRRAVDRVRSEQASRRRIERDAGERSMTVPAVDDAVHDDIDRARVRRALGKLTDTQREAVELAYYGGHTYREVAVLLGVPEGTVKTRIRDGMIRLRDEMGASA
jgi:RNA polymerase sigma-70 factor (ECF subfamily)